MFLNDKSVTFDKKKILKSDRCPIKNVSKWEFFIKKYPKGTDYQKGNVPNRKKGGNMEKKTRSITKWLYWFLFAVAVITVYKTLDNFSNIANGIGNFLGIITPFLAGILISYILYLPCRKLENVISKVKKFNFIKKRARKISVIIVYIIAIILIITLIKVILPPVVQSIIDLVNNLPNYYNMAMQKINELPEDSYLKSEQVINVVKSMQEINLSEVLNMDKITQYAQGAISFASSIFDVFVAVIVSVYVLIERTEILEFLKKLAGAVFEPKTYKNIGKYFNRTNTIFFNFLASQFLDAIVVGILVSIALSIMGVKYSVLLGFMVGLFNLIPYFGAIIAVIIATIITLLTRRPRTSNLDGNSNYNTSTNRCKYN